MTNHGMNQDQMIKFYPAMSVIRRFEERAAHLRRQGFIPGFQDPYVGQEGVAWEYAPPWRKGM